VLDGTVDEAIAAYQRSSEVETALSEPA